MAHRQPSDYRFESEIVQDILLQFGSGHPMRVWRNSVAKAYSIDVVKGVLGHLQSGGLSFAGVKKAIELIKRSHPIMFSVVGSADIMGILLGGRGLAIECKMPGEKLDPHQATWRDMWVEFGGLHITANCIDDVYAGLHAAGVVTT